MAICWPSLPSALGNINRFFTRYAAEKLTLQTILRARGPVFVGACSAIRLYVNQKRPSETCILWCLTRPPVGAKHRPFDKHGSPS